MGSHLPLVKDGLEEDELLGTSGFTNAPECLGRKEDTGGAAEVKLSGSTREQLVATATVCKKRARRM